MPTLHFRRSGYTLVEIMLVLSIIAVLMAAGIYYLVGNLDVAKRTRVRGDIETLTTQLKVYEMENLTFPTSAQGLDALVNPPTLPPKPRRWTQLLKKEALLDPWGSNYQYLNPGKHNPKGFDIWSLGPDRKESDDDIGNWQDD